MFKLFRVKIFDMFKLFRVKLFDMFKLFKVKIFDMLKLFMVEIFNIIQEVNSLSNISVVKHFHISRQEYQTLLIKEPPIKISYRV